jgi:signal transduction histidine kinase
MSETRDLVLIVDDNDVARYAKRRTLQRAGYEVVEAATGGEALERLAEHEPRLLVLDVQLPDMSGWEVCRRIKEQNDTRSTLVLQVSATYVREEDTVRALEGGADACLTEPIEPTVLVATVRALLRTRHAEDALRGALQREQAARSLAESANRAKDEFLAMLGHELRNPLGAICNAIAVARLGADNRERALEIAGRQAEQLTKLIDELLDVARITHGRIALRTERVPLHRVLAAALETAEIFVREHGHRLHVEVPEAPIEVEGDPGRLEQVFVNLLENSAKYTERGGEISVSLSAGSGRARVSVRDNGAGIPPEMLQSIFELFTQGQRPLHRPQSGLGLGLSLVRRIVELHGGEVVAHSEGPGHGSEFLVSLPLAPAHSVGASSARTSGAHEARQLDVVVIEDDHDARESLAMLLERFGHKVRVFGDGRAGIDGARRQPPDVLIVDIGLPEIDGYDVVRLARAHPSLQGVPLVALTGYSRPHGRPAPLEAGFTHHLVKPVEPAALRALLAALPARRA